MTKLPGNRGPRARGTAPRIQPQPYGNSRFTAPARVAAERASNADALLQFPSEIVERSVPPPPPRAAAPQPRAVPRHVPAPPAQPVAARMPQEPATYAIPLAPRAVIWLGVAVVVGGSLLWLAISFGSGADAPAAALESSRAPLASVAPALPLAAADPPQVRSVDVLAAQAPANPAKPPVNTAKAPANTAKPPVNQAKPSANTAKPPANTVRLAAAPPAPRAAAPAAKPAAVVARQQAPARVAEAPAAPTFRGSLTIASEPVGARVFVNGRAVGTTPLELHDLAAGSRVVRLEADGYNAWWSAVRIVADQQTRVSATLHRTATP